MKLYLTRDEEGLCLWRAKPFLGSDNFWYEEEEGYDNITEDIYYSLTNYRDLPKNDELVEIEVDITSKDSSKEHIKNRRHK